MPSDFNCVKIHPWVLQVTLHLPSAGISEVVNRSGTSEENIHKHWQIATKTCTNHHWRELGFAGIHSPALWGQQGQILGEHWCTPRRAEGPHTHRARVLEGRQSQRRVLSPGTGQAQQKLPAQLPREPASTPDAPAGKVACVPIAKGTAGLWSPSRERKGRGAGRILYHSAGKIDNFLFFFFFGHQIQNKWQKRWWPRNNLKNNLKNKKLSSSAAQGFAPFHMLKYLFLPGFLSLKIVLKSFDPDT